MLNESVARRATEVAVRAAQAAAEGIRAAESKLSSLVWIEKGAADFVTEVDRDAEARITEVVMETTDGEISCRALVDGEEVKQRTSGSGTFATASCTHFALD